MTELTRNEKVQICKVVAQAILADGRLEDSERALLDELMDRYALDDAERKDVLARNIGDDPAVLAAGIEAPETKNALLVELAMAVAVDGGLAKAEHQLIAEVATALGVAQSELDDLIKTALQ
jgi:uncharacterized tellurite resistance protein B-like protein